MPAWRGQKQIYFYLYLYQTTTFVGLENGVVGKLVLRPARNSFSLLQALSLCALRIASSLWSRAVFWVPAPTSCTLHFTSLHYILRFTVPLQLLFVLLFAVTIRRRWQDTAIILHCHQYSFKCNRSNTMILTHSYRHVSSVWHLLVQFIPRDFKTAMLSLTLTGFLYINDQLSLSWCHNP